MSTASPRFRRPPAPSISHDQSKGKADHRLCPMQLRGLFQPVFTTKPTVEGTGLGLSISYDITQPHAGMIEVGSAVDEFTRIHRPTWRVGEARHDPGARRELSRIGCFLRRADRGSGRSKVRKGAAIGIGGHLAMPPLPHHRAYGSVPRRFDWVKLGQRHGVGEDRVSRSSDCAGPVGPPGVRTCARTPSANRRRPLHRTSARHAGAVR
jgi:hypothetical protein